MYVDGVSPYSLSQDVEGVCRVAPEGGSVWEGTEISVLNVFGCSNSEEVWSQGMYVEFGIVQSGVQ